MQENLRRAGPIGIWDLNAELPPLSVQSFALHARERGISVYYVWTPTLRFDAYREAPHRKFFDQVRRMYQGIGVQVLGVPEHYELAAEDMLDSGYHTNERGREIATRQLGRDLCAVIACKIDPSADESSR